MLCFGDAPENLADTGEQFPVIIDPGPRQLTDIAMRSLLIILIDTVEQFGIEALCAVVPLMCILRFGNSGEVTVVLHRAQRVFKKHTRLTTDITEELTGIYITGSDSC
jgi:hypothetical protein